MKAPAMTKVIFWRHGQTDYNLQGRIQGSHDIQLNETGVAQARLAAEQIAKYEPARIYSSTLCRAEQTAKPLQELLSVATSAGDTPVAIHTDLRLAERKFGLWEGLTADEICKKWQAEYQRWRSGKQPEGVGVEPLQEVGQRFAQCVQEVVSGTDDDCIVFVSHGSVIMSGIITMLGFDPQNQRFISVMDNCNWAVLDLRTKSNTWVLSGYNLSTNSQDKQLQITATFTGH